MLRSVAACLLALAMASSPSPAGAQSWQIPPQGYGYVAAKGCPAEPADANSPPAKHPARAQYHVCADQMRLFGDALAKAREARRLLIVEFGATWCGWCRSLQDQFPTDAVLGRKGERVDYGQVFDKVAIGISTIADKGQTGVPSGLTVLDLVVEKAKAAKIRAVPFIAVLDPADAAKVVVRNIDDLANAKTGKHDADRFRAFLTEAHDSLRGNAPIPAEPGWLRRKLDRLWGRLFG